MAHTLSSLTRHLCQISVLPPEAAFSPPAIVAYIARFGKRIPLSNGRFDAFALCLHEGLGVRKGGTIGKFSTLEANHSQEELGEHSSEVGKVFRS